MIFVELQLVTVASSAAARCDGPTSSCLRLGNYFQKQFDSFVFTDDWPNELDAAVDVLVGCASIGNGFVGCAGDVPIGNCRVCRLFMLFDSASDEIPTACGGNSGTI